MSAQSSAVNQFDLCLSTHRLVPAMGRISIGHRSAQLVSKRLHRLPNSRINVITDDVLGEAGPTTELSDVRKGFCPTRFNPEIKYCWDAFLELISDFPDNFSETE
jgi:hypothetical protein